MKKLLMAVTTLTLMCAVAPIASASKCNCNQVAMAAYRDCMQSGGTVFTCTSVADEARANCEDFGCTS